MIRPFRHRTIVAVAIAGLITAVLSAAAESSRLGSRDEAEIRAVLSAQVTAWNRGDIDGFMKGYARSAATEFVAGDQLTRGWQTVRYRYRKKYDSREKMGTLTFSELDTLSAAFGAYLQGWLSGPMGSTMVTRKIEE